MKKLTVLNVAYPFAPVGTDAVGGAEQILAQLDYALAYAGHHSIVVACEGSVTAGTLVGTPPVDGTVSEERRRWNHEQHRAAIEHALSRWQIDLVHFHGIDFYAYLPAPAVPLLVTLHGPRSWYPPDIFSLGRTDLFFHCVSASQRSTCPADAPLLPSIPNGVSREYCKARHGKRKYAVALGRICPEKNFHVAINAAKKADFGLLLAGQVFHWDPHQQYFHCEIKPRLDHKRLHIGPVGFVRKRRLLAAARCLLLPSLASETSSLVAMESLACGTPVVAFPAGALPDIVEHGKTGFIVENETEMAEAIHAAEQLDPEDCRNAARARFSLDRMLRRYFDLYHQLAQEVVHA